MMIVLVHLLHHGRYGLSFTIKVFLEEVVNACLDLHKHLQYGLHRVIAAPILHKLDVFDFLITVGFKYLLVT